MAHSSERHDHPGATDDQGPRRVAAALLAGDPEGLVSSVAAQLGAVLSPIGSQADYAGATPDAVVITLTRRSLADAERAVRAASRRDSAVAIVAVCGRLSAGEVITLVRAGASDVVMRPTTQESFGERLNVAFARTDMVRSERDRAERLARMCRVLADERQVAAGLVDAALSNEQVSQYPVGESAECSGVAGQFAERVQEELDVEELLRCALEFVLERVGITNAVILLPSSSGDWAVGAFVNADMPPDTADATLEQLAGSVPPAVAAEVGPLRLLGVEEIEPLLGVEAAAWLGRAETIVVPCDHAGDRMAIVLAYRPAATPFADEDVSDISTIADVFTRQLAKIVRVHNRTCGELQWFGFDVGDEPGSGGESDEADWWKNAA